MGTLSWSVYQCLPLSLEIGGMNKKDIVDGLFSSALWPPTVTARPRAERVTRVWGAGWRDPKPAH